MVLLDRLVLMVQFLKPKLLKQHKTDLEQYPLAPTSTSNRSILQLLFWITLFNGKYLLTLALFGTMSKLINTCHWKVYLPLKASIFSSHGRVSSMRVTLFSLFEKIVMSGLSLVNPMWGGKEKVPSRSSNKTQSDAWCNIPLGEEFLVFTLVPLFTNFIF